MQGQPCCPGMRRVWPVHRGEEKQHICIKTYRGGEEQVGHTENQLSPLFFPFFLSRSEQGPRLVLVIVQLDGSCHSPKGEKRKGNLQKTVKRFICASTPGTGTEKNDSTSSSIPSRISNSPNLVRKGREVVLERTRRGKRKRKRTLTTRGEEMMGCANK